MRGAVRVSTNTTFSAGKMEKWVSASDSSLARCVWGRWPPPLSDSRALLTAWSSGHSRESLGVSPLAELILRSTSRTGPVYQAIREQHGAPRRTYHRLLGACLVVSSSSVCTMAAPVKFDAVKFVLDCASGVMVGSDWWKLARCASS